MITARFKPILALLLVVATPLMAHAQRATGPDALPPMMLLTRVPAGAIEIAEAMGTARTGEEIVIRGRVTEGNDVFVDNRAILRLADEASMPACCAPGASPSNTACSVPANRRATIQFLDTRERLIRVGLRGMHGLSVGKEVFIVGTVMQADHDRTLIINATGMHVPAGDIPIGLMVDSAPTGAVDVGAVKSIAKVGDRVVLRGWVGGASVPLTDGEATMTIVDRAVEPCPSTGAEACKTPWDACATPRAEIAAKRATIEVVAADGTPIRTDLRGRHDLRELSTVTIVGVVASTTDGNLVVRATAIHVAHSPDAHAVAD